MRAMHACQRIQSKKRNDEIEADRSFKLEHTLESGNCQLIKKLVPVNQRERELFKNLSIFQTIKTETTVHKMNQS